VKRTDLSLKSNSYSLKFALPVDIEEKFFNMKTVLFQIATRAISQYLFINTHFFFHNLQLILIFIIFISIKTISSAAFLIS